MLFNLLCILVKKDNVINYWTMYTINTDACVLLLTNSKKIYENYNKHNTEKTLLILMVS